MAEWFAKTERFAQLLVDLHVPATTMEMSLSDRFGHVVFPAAASAENSPGRYVGR